MKLRILTIQQLSLRQIRQKLIKANIKLDNLRKNAQSGIDAKVNVQLECFCLKRLNNLPTAKAKVDFLVNKGTISKSIGKDLQAAIGKAYSDVSRKFKDFPGLMIKSLIYLLIIS